MEGSRHRAAHCPRTLRCRQSLRATRQLRIEGDQKIGTKGERTNYEIDVVCPLFFQVIERKVGEGPWAITFATWYGIKIRMISR